MIRMRRKKVAILMFLIYIFGTVWMIPLIIPDEVRLPDPIRVVLKK